MNTFDEKYGHPYEYDPKYKKRVAYFCMEFAIDQPLKIYSGGLGFLAGSHMRSAYGLKQNMIGIGMLWRNGYYDQVRTSDRSMEALFQAKFYSFLQPTDIKFKITINHHDVWVTAMYLAPETFKTVPMFLLSTDLPENDYLARSTSFRLYDSDVKGKVAQNMLLGIGGAMLLDALDAKVDLYHFNEAHALSAAFWMYKQNPDKAALKKKLAFTTHTPEEAGNEKHDIGLLNQMGFFAGLELEEVRKVTAITGNTFDHSLAALRLAGLANGVSQLHGEVSRQMWGSHEDICPIIHITNAQNAEYWADGQLNDALKQEDTERFLSRKRFLKTLLFEIVADQTGKILDPDVLTVVWARRFAEYKRPDLITRDLERFERLMNDTERPIQIIWAGKPYPMDYSAISTFNGLVHLSREYNNMAVLVGYELKLSSRLKKGSDIWLNNPRVTREASGTSGMTAAMNASVNFSTNDGWIREFAKDKVNSYVVPIIDTSLPNHEQDEQDMTNLLDTLENEILPTYYEPEKWMEMVKNSMEDVLPFFGSNRMAMQYYDKLYSEI